MLHDHKETNRRYIFGLSFATPDIGKRGTKPLGGFAELMRLFTTAGNSVHYTNILFGSTFSVAGLRKQHF